MRVAAHNAATIWGGAERATTMLLRGLMDRGHDVVLYCNNEIVAQRASEEGVPTAICVIAGDFSLHHSFRLASKLRAYRPDAFIVGTYKKLFLATLAARMARVPRIVARVGLESDTPRSFKYRFALRRWTDAVVVNARRIVAPFASLSGFGAGRVTLIHNGVAIPDDNVDATTVRDQLGIEPGHFVIGTVSRLARQKRIDRLVSVAALLPEEVHVVIAGDGKQREVLEQQMAQLGLSHRVHFIGHRDDKDVVFAALDLFVITSDTEGLSNAMLEAMARGIPVVSTPVSGAEEALAADSRGNAPGVIADFDPAAVARSIEDLIREPLRLKRMSATARERARAEFSLDTMLDRWEMFLSSTGPRAS